MKCPLRVNALGDLGDCLPDECAWWDDGCVVHKLVIHESAVPIQLTLLKADKMYTAEELSAILNLNRDRVYVLARQKVLPSVCIGRQLRFSGAAIEQFIAEGGKSFR